MRLYDPIRYENTTLSQRPDPVRPLATGRQEPGPADPTRHSELTLSHSNLSDGPTHSGSQQASTFLCDWPVHHEITRVVPRLSFATGLPSHYLPVPQRLVQTRRFFSALSIVMRQSGSVITRSARAHPIHCDCTQHFTPTRCDVPGWTTTGPSAPKRRSVPQRNHSDPR